MYFRRIIDIDSIIYRYIKKNPRNKIDVQNDKGQFTEPNIAYSNLSFHHCCKCPAILHDQHKGKVSGIKSVV